MSEEKKIVEFDSTDWPGMRKLMDRHAEFDTMLFSKNQNEETMHISIFEDRIICVVYQHNHWIRKMVYWRDGTVEELYEGKWED